MRDNLRLPRRVLRAYSSYIFMSLFDYEELETLICGQLELYFEEQQDNCINANGFTPTNDVMV